MSRQAGTWEQVRPQVLAALQQRQQLGVLVAIALHEGEVVRALELLPQARGGWQDYTREVAQAAESAHPHAALELYSRLVERSIAHRSRPAYQQVVSDLTRMQQLYLRLGASPDWETYIQALRTRYPTLRALHDELHKARL